MIIIRPICQSDHAALLSIAKESGVGFTSLPVNEELVKSKIDSSESAFSKQVSAPSEESYLFVMEDTDSGEILGTTGIHAAVGLEDAFYHYHIGKVVHASRELKIHNTAETLTFCNDYTGVTEICTLFLREQFRQGLNGRFLSKVRFLFMAEHKERFSETIIAEMRGVSNENGESPFWNWLEEHFFSMDFPTADYLTGIGNKVFIAELMPKYPIYVSLLSPEAQSVIGKVHEKTKPALKLLENEGFSSRGYVDIFDAGPTVEANINHIRTVQASRKMPIEIASTLQSNGDNYFIINTETTKFRAVVGEIQLDEQRKCLLVTQDVASALQVQSGDMVRFSPVAFSD